MAGKEGGRLGDKEDEGGVWGEKYPVACVDDDAVTSP